MERSTWPAMRSASPVPWFERYVCRTPVRGIMVLALIAGVAGGCSAPQTEQQPDPAAGDRDRTDICLTDVAPQAGVVHPIICGAADKPYLIDTNGTGAAVLDFDQDGWMDVYVVHGATIDAWAAGATPNRLYRNRGDGTFTEVAGEVGVADRAWGSGALAWDYDNDGDSDLYVTNYGANRLYRNDGGTFTEVTAASGLLDDSWSMGAAAADYDNDGDLDLYVAHYFSFDLDDPPGNTAQGGEMECTWKGADVACGPIGFEAEPDRLFRNEGNGRFTDVSATSGIWEAEPGFGMGVLWIDLDDDGLLDIYVANDAAPNLAYRNQGDGRFSEVGDWSGLALGHSAVPQSGMGVTAGDTDGDGTEEVFVTNYSHQTNALYVAAGAGMYDDSSALAGLGDISFRFLGWGTTFFDVENDGDLDLIVANGHVYPEVDVVDESTSYRQKDLLFVNDGSGGFDPWQPPAGSPLAEQTSSRGLVRIDFDNDGDSDIWINSIEAPPRLLRNDTETAAAGGWLGIVLEGTSCNRDAAGARVRVTAGGRQQMLLRRLGSSYMSSEDPRLLFGLGGAGTADVEVVWPNGAGEKWHGLEAGRYHRLYQGSSESRVTAGQDQGG